MKSKVLIIMTILMLIMFTFSASYALTTIEEYDETSEATQLKEAKEGVAKTLEEYKERYGSAVYGTVGYFLNIVRIYSVPLCFLGIAVGAVYQYIIGIRRLDIRDRGFAMIRIFVTILLICQVLPLIFAIVVNGWRG